jgi:hypothetical protein
MKNNANAQIWLGITALCLLLLIGCGANQMNSGNTVPPAFQRVDWGESLTPGGSAGIGQFPAKFTFDVTATPDCVNDYVAFTTTRNFTALAPGPSIVAFNQLYSTQGVPGGLCNQDGPSVYWSYYTAGSEGFTPTSPVLSLDGTKVAFIETAGDTNLQIVKWKAGQGTIATPAVVDTDITGSSWSACPAGNSCIVSLPIASGITDTISAPFVDYQNDVLYVGDNAGRLHKFTGVFNGTPAEATAPWPMFVSPTNSPITGPIFDSVSGNIYVGDTAGALIYVRDAGSTVGTCSSSGPVTPPCVGATVLQVGTGGAVVDAPIVDGTNQTVFAVNGTDTTNNGTILQASTDFVTSVVSFGIGGTAAGSALYGGAFDNTYIGSSPGSIAGHMYVCGKDQTKTDSPALYQLSFNSAGILTSVGTPLTGLAGSSGEACSPVTEFFNTGTSIDWIFFSLGNNANTAVLGNPLPLISLCRTGLASGAGCIISIDVTAAASWPPATVNNTAPLPANAAGGSSGIVVDNVSTSPQTSNIYFSLGGNSVGIGPGLPSCNTTPGVGCAIKLTQSGFN